MLIIDTPHHKESKDEELDPTDEDFWVYIHLRCAKSSIPDKHMVQELAKKGFNSELNELETFFATKGVQIAPFEEQKLYWRQ